MTNTKSAAKHIHEAVGMPVDNCPACQGVSQHTPGPWTYQGSMNSREIRVAPLSLTTWNYEGKRCPRSIQANEAIAVITMVESIESSGGNIDSIAAANAEFIVRACNAHDELLEAVKNLIQELESNKLDRELGNPVPAVAKALAAIARAEGE